MRKKVLILFMLFCIGITFFGCGSSTKTLVEDNLSEVTKVYYLGENENFYCTLSSGEREEIYLVNGTSTKKTPFALLSIVPTNAISKNLIKATISIDGIASEVELEINGLNHNFMVDLEKELSGKEIIEVTFENSTLTLENLSNGFGVNYEKALEIASNEMEEKILEKKSYKNLNSEFYLRILDKKANQFDEIFWGFTILNIDGESYSIVFSTEDGSVLAKSN